MRAATLPRSEADLAHYVGICIVGGSKDLAQHLKGITLRVEVMRLLLIAMRNTGLDIYSADSVNSPARMEARLRETYEQPYPAVSHSEFEPFIPNSIKKMISEEQWKGEQPISLVQDKVATPADAFVEVDKLELGVLHLGRG